MIIRCTNTVLKLIDTPPEELVSAEPSNDDWYANLFFVNRRRCLLLAHAGTLFPVLAADVRKGDLLSTGRVAIGLIRQSSAERSCPETAWASWMRRPSGLRGPLVDRCSVT